MASNPYADMPDHQFWRRSVSNMVATEVDPVVSAEFKITRSDRIATAGSCFAQHISRYLQTAGFTYFVPEQAHPLFEPNLLRDFNYGTFSCRYGNIYTSRQLAQLLQRAYAKVEPVDKFWEEPSGRYVDPYRPQIQPGGFASLQELFLDQHQHFASIQKMVEGLDVFVFTLGLTEMWASKIDGFVYPICPGVAGGRYDAHRHAFINLTVQDVVADLTYIVNFVRKRNVGARFILTVSPVPLIATATGNSVLTATTYSKSVLRVAAGIVADRFDGVAYFPSYEMIVGTHSRGAFFAEDLRSVTEEGVRYVMRMLLRHYAADTQGQSQPITSKAAESISVQELERLADVICEEELLDKLPHAGSVRSLADN